MYIHIYIYIYIHVYIYQKSDINCSASYISVSSKPSKTQSRYNSLSN